MKNIFSILFALALIAVAVVPAYAQDGFPQPPHLFEGTARTLTPAGPVPAGTLVQAFVGVELRALTTTGAGGHYYFEVPGTAGDWVTFKVAGVTAHESTTWVSGELEEGFDLTIDVLPTLYHDVTMAVSPVGTGTATDVTGASPYAAGVAVSIKAEPASGYEFVGWTAAAGSFANANAPATTFTMPAQDVTVTANFAVGGPTTWYVVEGGAGAQDGINWNNAFATIQEAVDVAGPGDTIEVAAGEYDAFQVIGKTDISIIGAEGAIVTTANLITALPVVGNAWVMTAVYESENINIEGINFDGTEVSGKEVFVGIAYVDSTGTIARLTVENVIATELGAGVAIIGDRDTPTVEITGATISNNDDTGIYVCGGSTLEAHFNTIVDNAECGVLNDGGKTVDAIYNWWGHASGPLHLTNLLGRGNAVIGNVDFKPWLGGEVVTEPVTGGGIVDAIAEANTEVVVDGKATVTIFKYASNPYPEAPVYGTLASLDLLATDDWVELPDTFVDISFTDTEPETEAEVRVYYTDAALNAKGVDEDTDTLRLYSCDGQHWVPCSTSEGDNGVNTTNVIKNGTLYSGYMWAEIRETGTTPTLAQLTGTPWGGYGHPSQTSQPPCGCFIATAAYGTDTAREIDILREFRDEVLLPNILGTEFVSLYYRTSPPIADFTSRHEVLRTVVRVGFVDVIIAILNCSHDLWP